MTAVTDHLTPFADRVFDRAGCHPRALERLHGEEASTVVWLTAAMLYTYNLAIDGPHTGREDHRYTMRPPNPNGWDGWPNIFWHPIHRAPLAEFWGRFWRLRQDTGDDAQTIEWDTDTLRRWLGYARKRFQTCERYMLARYLTGAITGSGGDIVTEANALMAAYQSHAPMRFGEGR